MSSAANLVCCAALSAFILSMGWALRLASQYLGSHCFTAVNQCVDDRPGYAAFQFCQYDHWSDCYEVQLR